SLLPGRMGPSLTYEAHLRHGQPAKKDRHESRASPVLHPEQPPRGGALTAGKGGGPVLGSMVVRLKRLPRTIVRGAIEAPSFAMGTFAALREYLVTPPVVR